MTFWQAVQTFTILQYLKDILIFNIRGSSFYYYLQAANPRALQRKLRTKKRQRLRRSPVTRTRLQKAHPHQLCRPLALAHSSRTFNERLCQTSYRSEK
ncbi:Hypothetical protein FKW44_020336 [Caligus rogercresseyi]|uniref:Uncharacterized protein n=1 Tax=Caligus rogercresseyi TaxID=217165 RepID=A0A7T8GXN3_CALRO|nr:Hypothetical protein FKW44_020336 [Caligus rogercresseyi]